MLVIVMKELVECFSCVDVFYRVGSWDVFVLLVMGFDIIGE